jgi:hypothetical protein
MRIKHIVNDVTVQLYKSKISSDLSQRFANLHKIIISKSIYHKWLNEYEDNHYLARLLQQDTDTEGPIGEPRQICQCNTPNFSNVFDDFDEVIETYTKHKLIEADYNEVKLIHAIITNQNQIQVIEDSHSILTDHLSHVLEGDLHYKTLNLKWCDQ